jgi:hypothetical protein
VLDDVQRLVANLIAMNEILRDHERVSVRLVMTPDRMVIDEARRTFTYLNLYGYLTDAVVVNRIFPPEVGDYFDGWRERQQRALHDVEAAFAPVPVLTRATSARRSSARGCSTGWARRSCTGTGPDEVLHDRVGERLELSEEGARPAAGAALRQQGRDLAEEARAGAHRPRQRREAHDAPAPGHGRAAAGRRVVRRRRPARGVRARRGAWLRRCARTTRSTTCARGSPRPRRPRSGWRARLSTRRASGRRRVPPQGWAAPQDHAARQEEAQALVALLQALRELVPAELQAQLTRSSGRSCSAAGAHRLVGRAARAAPEMRERPAARALRTSRSRDGAPEAGA